MSFTKKHENHEKQKSRIRPWDLSRSIERPRKPNIRPSDKFRGLIGVDFDPNYCFIRTLKRWTTRLYWLACLPASLPITISTLGRHYSTLSDTIWTLFDTIWHYPTLSRQYSTLFDTIRNYSTRFQHYSTLFDTIRHCLDTIRHYSILFDTISTLFDTIRH